MDALIGFTGFVGGNLLRQRPFDGCFNSGNIAEIEGNSYDLVVCAGAPAAKWKANKEPAADLQNIESLIARLGRIEARRFVLISTVDVYASPRAVDETTPVIASEAQPYGKHRRMLESFCIERFGASVIRLPGLFGTGLKKNVIFDLIHDNLVDQIHPGGSFQYYDLEWIWRDVERVLASGIKLVNFATEPVLTQDIARHCFGRELVARADPPAPYDMWTTHAALWNTTGRYLADRATILERIRAFVQSERQ